MPQSPSNLTFGPIFWCNSVTEAWAASLVRGGPVASRNTVTRLTPRLEAMGRNEFQDFCAYWVFRLECAVEGEERAKKGGGARRAERKRDVTCHDYSRKPLAPRVALVSEIPRYDQHCPAPEIRRREREVDEVALGLG
ncbi:hypothetical protein C8F04DRAFT_1185758 [Mycena alexandri]|uniref:Uncharacterized protein n=1 Tax=Mycena alexandri TaxID=1745969 RepID=A0AAD6SQ44_9AGAR|nr:hypothetical protein C8F04DRAFT_1185758 [Mycena alexandri]